MRWLPDERREVDDGVSGKELLLYALEQGGGNDIQLQSHGAPGFQSRLAQDLGEFLQIPVQDPGPGARGRLVLVVGAAHQQ